MFSAFIRTSPPNDCHSSENLLNHTTSLPCLHKLITLRFDVQNLECIPEEAVWDLKPGRTAGSDHLCGQTHIVQPSFSPAEWCPTGAAGHILEKFL
ncbi:hypothetical protein ILYODFUR_006237 [Ilyodon furcidens]|uniref:Uncharacterized protein n=1 Tax=Ilyodon furcidens TaxID=33524 RepID=A0ABV0U707_9TELE